MRRKSTNSITGAQTMKTIDFAINSDLPVACIGPQLEPSGNLATILPTLREWRQRASTRRALSQLSTAALQDIGIDQDRADAEAAKPFWRI
jgi:uncharacterized protein YjiS (DUF1127 family)